MGAIAEGDLVQANYQYEYNGVVMGAGTPYIVDTIEGLLSMPDLEMFDQERNDGHGSFAGRSILRARTVTFDLKVLAETSTAGTDIETYLRNLAKAFYPRNTQAKFVFQRPGFPKRFLYARPSRREFETGYEVAKGLAEGSVELVCSDPRMYGMTETTASVTLVSVTSNSVVVTNGGDFPHSPVVEIVGPAVNPRVTNVQDSNRTAKFDISLTASDTLIVDFLNKTVTLAGVNRYDVVRNDNQWWELQPGANTITMTRTGTTGTATLRVKERDTWL